MLPPPPVPHADRLRLPLRTTVLAALGALIGLGGALTGLGGALTVLGGASLLAGCSAAATTGESADAGARVDLAAAPADLTDPFFPDLELPSLPAHVLQWDFPELPSGIEYTPQGTKELGNQAVEWVWKMEYASNEIPHHIGFLGFDEHTTIAPIYSPSVREQRSTVIFPAGHALSLAPGQKISLSAHYVNASPRAYKPSVTLKIYTLPKDAAPPVPLYFAVFQTDDILLPPQQKTDIDCTCPLPIDVELYTMMSHQHQLGLGVDSHVVGGADDGRLLYTTPLWENPPVNSFAPPLHLKKGDAVQWVCHYENTTAAVVRNGARATDEMCGVAGYIAGARGTLVVTGFRTPGKCQYYGGN